LFKSRFGGNSKGISEKEASNFTTLGSFFTLSFSIYVFGIVLPFKD